MWSKKAIALYTVALFVSVAKCAEIAADPSEILDNDLATVCKPLDRALDVLVILDGSGSVGGGTFETQLRMLRRLIDIAEFGPDKTKLAVLQYAGYTKIEFTFNQYLTKEEIRMQVDKIRYISGTTRTGKALRKALDTFTVDKGARINRNDVAQVVVVVTDGHSQDDPVPAAEELRQKGVIVLAVGIGDYVNMDELLEIAKDSSKAFKNDSLSQFEEAFKKIAVGEICHFAKGAKGAEILCGNESITVNVLTRKPFQGRFYAKNHLKDPFCSVRGGRVVGDPREISLKIPLNSCGVREQFLFAPRGVLFETSAVLMFHSDYNTALDRTFTIRCFYPDSSNGAPNVTELMHFGDKDPNQEDVAQPSSNGSSQDEFVYSLSLPNMRPPCVYTLRKHGVDGCLADSVTVGDLLYHRWECDTGEERSEFDMLVHSCYVADDEGQQRLVIDSKGCSVDPIVLGTPTYPKPLLAHIEAPVVKFADRAITKFKCSLKFCNRKRGECANLTPPDCDRFNVSAKIIARAERDVAFRDSPRLAQFMLEKRNNFSSLDFDVVSNNMSTIFPHTPLFPLQKPNDTFFENLPIRPEFKNLPPAPPAPPAFSAPLEKSNGTSQKPEENRAAFAIIREFDPSSGVQKNAHLILANVTDPERDNIEQQNNGTAFKNLTPSKPAVQFHFDSSDSNDNEIPSGVDVVPETPSIASTATTPQANEMNIQGLSHKIMALIEFNRVDLESQTIMIHDVDQANKNRTPLDVCKS